VLAEINAYLVNGSLVGLSVSAREDFCARDSMSFVVGLCNSFHGLGTELSGGSSKLFDVIITARF